MKFKNYIFTLLAFMFCLNIFAKDKLITIYDNDCGFCHSLLNETYTNELVKEQLNNYEHLLFEAETKEGTTTILKGFINTNQQLQFLKNPEIFKHELNIKKSNTLMLFEQDDFLPQMVINYLCTTINNANRSDADPFEKFIEALESMTTRMKIKVENYNKYAFENLDKLVCENHDTVKMRKFNTILKHAIDSRNYDFIRGAIIIEVNGRNVCNPYIDFTRKELIGGEEETLIQFIDKLLNKNGMDASHNFDAIRDIKLEVEGCIIKQNTIKK
jgi:hypothetical protein